MALRTIMCTHNVIHVNAILEHTTELFRDRTELTIAVRIDPKHLHSEFLQAGNQPFFLFIETQTIEGLLIFTAALCCLPLGRCIGRCGVTCARQMATQLCTSVEAVVQRSP